MISSDWLTASQPHGGSAGTRAARRKYLAGAAGIGIASLLAACGGSSSADGASAGDKDLAKVSIRYDVTASGYDAPFVLARDKGWFKDAGMDLQLGEGNGSGTTVQLVSTGKDTFGWADFGAMTKLVGEGAPVKAVGVFVQQTPVSIITLEENGVNSPKDLEGKTIGLDPQGASTVMFNAIAAKVGVDKSKIKILALKADVEAQLLVSKKTDAFVGFKTFQGPQVEQLGGAVKYIRGSDVGVNLLNLSLVVNNKYLNENKDQACKFVEVTAKAFEYSAQHPDEAVDALVAEYPNVKPDVAKKQLTGTLELLHTESTTNEPLGKVAAADVEQTVNLLETYGGMKKGIDPSSLYTNDCFK